MRWQFLKEKAFKKLKIEFNKSPTLSNTRVEKTTYMHTPHYILHTSIYICLFIFK